VLIDWLDSSCVGCWAIDEHYILCNTYLPTFQAHFSHGSSITKIGLEFESSS
jgi:hypothetical protein